MKKGLLTFSNSNSLYFTFVTDIIRLNNKRRQSEINNRTISWGFLASARTRGSITIVIPSWDFMSHKLQDQGCKVVKIVGESVAQLISPGSLWWMASK